MSHLLTAALLAVAYLGLFVVGANQDWREGAFALAGVPLIYWLIIAFFALLLIRPRAAVAAHATLNENLHKVCQAIAISALAIMVCMILAQVYFRYVAGGALNWTEEAARFGMLWMTGLMAPVAYRRGGFVSIDMLERALPRALSAALSLLLLCVAFWVLVILFDRGWNNHVDTMSGRGASSSLRIPLDMLGGERIRFRSNWQYASLLVGVALLLIVSVELILRQILVLLGRADGLKPLVDDEEFIGAD